MPDILPADWPFYLLPLVGHTVLWLGIVNNIHATGLPRWAVKAWTVVAEFVTAAAPLRVIYLLAAWQQPGIEIARTGGGSWTRLPWAWQAYLAATSLVTAVAVPWWLLRRLRRRPPWVLRHERSTIYDLGAGLDRDADLNTVGRLYARVPGNEILRLEITEKTLDIPRLPQRLAGLSIAHLSDLHFTGRIGKAYFQRVVEHTNELQADLVVVTGDLVEVETCFSWIEETLARLSARYGTYFVLGNHDMRADPQRLRRMLVEAGHVDLGGLWHAIEVEGQRVLLAGNELPWFAPAADISGNSDAALRILLSHSPDQFDFARRHGYDLLLAGHTHGGQVQLPWVGPIVAPSRHGVKYASGTFYEPPTVMHVSRGVSGEVPWRWNCLPEVSKLTLVPSTRISDVDEDRPLAASAC